jgi:hypothetical protein
VTGGWHERHGKASRAEDIARWAILVLLLAAICYLAANS